MLITTIDRNDCAATTAAAGMSTMASPAAAGDSRFAVMQHRCVRTFVPEGFA